MNNYRIRVIVPCYNSDLTIEKCISSILNSKGVEFELYLIDDGNNTKLAIMQKDYPINVIKTSGQEGAGRARNIGTYDFNGQVVVFIDSDVQIHPDTLVTLIQPLKENLADATVGSYSKPYTKNFFNAYKYCYLAYRYYNKSTYLSNTFWSAICALDYEIFKKANGFKECYYGAGPEDIDLGVELSLNGARILSVPLARGMHLSEFSFIKILNNDIRKGCEDIYIHWTRKVPVRHNRHVYKSDIFAVFVACCIPFLLLFQYYIGFVPLVLSVLFYLIVRIMYLIKAFGGEDFLFLIRSFLLTYVLDVIRGYAILKGTLLYILEIISAGKYKPFAKTALLNKTIRIVKIAVIGTGYWGPNIIKNLLVLKQEVIIYDINRSNLQKAFQRFQECKPVNSLEDILQDSDIVAVAIVVPLKTHFELVIKSLQAGKHVYVEKPICYSTDEADRIKIQIKEKILMVGHITLYTPAISKIEEFIKNKIIGQITDISLTRSHLGPIYQDVDVASEVAVHDIAVLLYLLPDLPVTVNAWGTSRLGSEYYDKANIIIGYKNQLKYSINVQWTSAVRERMIVVEGTSGTIICKTINGKEELTLYDQHSAFEALKKGTKLQDAPLSVRSEVFKLQDEEPLYNELNSFLHCIENNLDPLTNFEFGRKVVCVSEAIRKSMKHNGKTERISW